MRALASIALAVLAAACGGTAVPTPLGNVPPRARLAAPLYAPVGQPVIFDAGASFDPDGAVLDYTFSFSDGTRQETRPIAEASHTFATSGAFEVAVLVRDDGGQLGRATQLVVVRTDPPACLSSSECTLGADCFHELCYATGAGPGPGVGDCLVDVDCGSQSTCRAGLCLAVGGSGQPAP